PGNSSGSGSSPLARNVATSMISSLKWICASLNRLPISLQFLKSLRICSGVASVTISKSFGALSISRSLTEPPTRHALKPLSRNRYMIRRALGLIMVLDMLWAERFSIFGRSGCIMVFHSTLEETWQSEYRIASDFTIFDLDHALSGFRLIRWTHG